MLPLAAVLAVRAARFGGDDPLANLEVAEVPDPSPGPRRGADRGRRRVAQPPRPLDAARRRLAPLTEPQVLGCDAAGTVLAYGDGEAPPGAPAAGDRGGRAQRDDLRPLRRVPRRRRAPLPARRTAQRAALPGDARRTSGRARRQHPAAAAGRGHHHRGVPAHRVPHRVPDALRPRRPAAGTDGAGARRHRWRGQRGHPPGRRRRPHGLRHLAGRGQAGRRHRARSRRGVRHRPRVASSR